MSETKPKTGTIGWTDLTIPNADLGRRLDACRARGGKVVRDPRDMGEYGRYAVIQDPAGAVATLIQPPLVK